MKRFHLFFWFSILLLITAESGHAQKTVGMGNNRLEPLTLDLNKITCRIVPVVKFDTNNRHQLIIKLNVEWFDKGGIPEKDESNALIVIDNMDLFRAVNENKITIEPGQETTFLNQPAPLFTENGQKVQCESFPNGGAIFNSSSMDIVLKIQGSENNEILLDLSFNYGIIKGAKKDIVIAAMKHSWSFIIQSRKLPGLPCDTKISSYTARYLSLERKYPGTNIENLLQKNNVTTAELESARKGLAEWTISLNKFSDSISSDAPLKDCQAQLNGLLGKISGLSSRAHQDMESLASISNQPVTNQVPAGKESTTPVSTGDQKETARKSTEQPAKPASAPGIENLREKYSVILNGLTAEFTGLNTEVNAGQAGIQSQLNYNAKRIAMVTGMMARKAQLSDNEQAQMTDELNVCKTMNEANDESNLALLVRVRDFKSLIENRKSICNSDFMRLDKKTLPEEGKRILADLETIHQKASSLEESLDMTRAEIIRQNNDILNLISKIQGNNALSEAVSHFDEQYKTLNSRLVGLTNRITATGNEFEQKKLDKWYLQSVKDDFLARTHVIGIDYQAIVKSYDSLQALQTETLRKFNFKPLIQSQDEFIKAESALGSRIETLRTNIESWEAVPFPYAKVIIAGLILLIIVFGLFVYLKAMRKKKVLRTLIRPAENHSKKIIKIQTSESNQLSRGKGLFNAINSGNNTYMELSLSDEWDDTAVSRVYFERDCIIKTYRFFEDSIHSAGTHSTAYETGGYLIGQWDLDPLNKDQFIVSLEDFIEPGDDATFSKYQLNFGAKIGIKLHSTLDNLRQKSDRDFVLTAWFHSHPGLKIFLSDFDLNVQEDFAGSINKTRMLALVLDPYTPKWDLGIFSYKTDGQMNNAVDSKKFFSFDLMYRWALNPQPQPQRSTDPPQAIHAASPTRPLPQLDNYFALNVNEVLADSPVRRVYISNPAIIELKRFIEDAKIALGSESFVARLGGDWYTHSPALMDVVIDNIIHITGQEISEEQKSDETVGIAYCLNDLQEDELDQVNSGVKRLKRPANRAYILLLVGQDRNSLKLIPLRNSDELTAATLHSAKNFQLSELIEWTRVRK